MADAMTPHDERRVSVIAGVDPRTVRAYLVPEKRAKMTSTTNARVAKALKACGFGALVPLACGCVRPAFCGICAAPEVL